MFRNSVLAGFMVLAFTAMVYVGCSTSSDGGGGDGGGGGDAPTAMSFDGETSVPATGASAIAIDYGVGLASVISSMLSTISVDADSQTPSASLKLLEDLQNVPLPLCGPPPGQGTAILSVELAPLGASLTFTDCVGSPLSGGAINGKILLTNLRFPEITATSVTATATGDVTGLSEGESFTIATGKPEDAVLDGRFAVNAAITLSDAGSGGTGGSGGAGGSAGAVEVTELDLDLGSSPANYDNWITVDEDGPPMEFRCFEISTRIATKPLAIDSFRPRGVLLLDDLVFTLNSFEVEPENIGFDLSGERAVPNSGTLTLFSGDEADCSSTFPEGDGSFATGSFRLEADDALVDIRAVAPNGTTVYECTETWENLLETLRDIVFASCPCVENCGTGGDDPVIYFVAWEYPPQCTMGPTELTVTVNAYDADDPNGDGLTYTGSVFSCMTEILIQGGDPPVDQTLEDCIASSPESLTVTVTDGDGNTDTISAMWESFNCPDGCEESSECDEDGECCDEYGF